MTILFSGELLTHDIVVLSFDVIFISGMVDRLRGCSLSKMINLVILQGDKFK